MTHRIRVARPDDEAAVAAFAADTWPDREFSDYVPAAFPVWVESEDPDARVVVAVDEADRPVGVCRAQLLTDEEAWIQGIRVHPDHRGAGVGTALTDHLAGWAADRGATVMRNMVFGWNEAGIAQSRAAGFRAVTALRWAEPEPDADASPALAVRDATGAAWAAWTDSQARDELGGLALADEAAWAVSELTRTRLDRLAATGRVVAVTGAGARGMTVRLGVRERRDADGESRDVADYAVAAWADAEAAASLLAAIAADAADLGAEATRVAVPESPTIVADVAAAGVSLNDEPEYVLARDLVAESA